MEPTENLSGGDCSRSGGYGCTAWTFDQLELEEDLMPSPFMLPDSPSPSPWLLSLPPAEGFTGPENFGDVGQISPLDEMPCLPFGDGQISSLDEVPCIPAAVAEETNYAAAPVPPLVATHGTGAVSSNFSLSSTTSDDFDEEEVQQKMVALQHFLHPPAAPDGLSNTTGGGPAARNHADAVPPVVQQGTSTTADDLPHPQQQLPLPTIDPEAHTGGGWAWPDLSLADKELQIQQMTPTISPSQPPSPTPVINPGPDEVDLAASAPMGSQGTPLPAAPQDQEDNILGRASTRCRANKSRGLRSLQLLLSQDGSGNNLVMRMVMDMIRQLGRYVGKMMEEEKRRSIVWQHFWRSQCKYCRTFNMICQYCNTVMIYHSTIQMLRHLESCDNYILMPPASSRASKTQRSSQALQIKEIVENPNGESEPIETDNSNCATAARVDTQGTKYAAVLSLQQPHQLLMDREEQIPTILSSQPCCQRQRDKSLAYSQEPKYLFYPLSFEDFVFLTEETVAAWWDFIIRLSDSSDGSSTTKSTHGGFRLKFYNDDSASTHIKITVDHVHSSAAWMHVSENPYKEHGGVSLQTDSSTGGVSLETGSSTIGSSHLWLGITCCDHVSASLLPGYAYPWHRMHLMLRSLGFRKEFATHFVIYALGWLDACNFRLSSPRSSNMGESIVEQGDAPSGKRKRKPLPPRSKVWNHFTKEKVVEAEGSMVIMARCNHCGSKLRAGSASHGTTQLKRHITSKHPDELAKSPL